MTFAPLPSPISLKTRWPAPASFITNSRNIAQQILTEQDKRLALIVGPCSIHDRESTLDYAQKLKTLLPAIEKNYFCIMRFFVEKPRTLFGWTGMVYDPFLDGSNNIAAGLTLARQLLIELAEMGIPCALELLNPLVVHYFDDLIVWGMIGARTSASQPHRQMASGLPFPVGFKNDAYGQIDSAIAGILFSQRGHSHVSIDPNGSIATMRTAGNPLTHLVLRGGNQHTNYDRASISTVFHELERHNLKKRIMVDCSHGNSGKDHRLQKIAFESVVNQVKEGNRGIIGMMLESFIKPGQQSIEGPLRYGVSLTDSCMGWEETESLLLRRYAAHR